MVDLKELIPILQQSGPITVVFYILLVIGQWMVFEKADQAGWKSLIPIYNIFVLWKIAGKSFLKFIGIFVLLILLITIMVGVSTVSALGFLVLLLPILYVVLIIYGIVESWSMCSNLSHFFGHKTGFTLGLFFLQPIFLIILGLNKDTYHKA